MIPTPEKIWFTAADLAELELAGMPRSKRAVNKRIAKEEWALRSSEGGMPLARRSGQRGGGLEYHVSLLPASARASLISNRWPPETSRSASEVMERVTVSFLADTIDTWFEKAKATAGFELRTPEVTDESGKVNIFVGYDPTGYFLEWDQFLEVPENATLMQYLS